MTSWKGEPSAADMLRFVEWASSVEAEEFRQFVLFGVLEGVDEESVALVRQAAVCFRRGGAERDVDTDHIEVARQIVLNMRASYYGY